MNHEKLRESVLDRTAGARGDTAETEAALVARQMDCVDLVTNGASLRQIARSLGISMEEARRSYAAGLARMADYSVDRAIALREEVTARQRELVLANMARAKAGDRASALIVQGADNLLASIWGLRSLRIEPPSRPADPTISDAVAAYLDGINQQTSP